MKDFYEFKHECEQMDCDEAHISFVKLNCASSSQFSFEKYVPGIGLSSTVLYGFKFCPYCGEKVD